MKAAFVLAALLLAGPAHAGRHRHSSARLHIPSLAIMRRRLAWVHRMNARYPVRFHRRRHRR